MQLAGPLNRGPVTCTKQELKPWGLNHAVQFADRNLRFHRTIHVHLDVCGEYRS